MKNAHRKAWGQLAKKFVSDANNFDESENGPFVFNARFAKRMVGLCLLAKEKGVSTKQMSLSFHPDHMRQYRNDKVYVLFKNCNDAVLEEPSYSVLGYLFFLYHNMPKDIRNSLCKKLEESSESNWFLQRWLANAVPFLFNILRAITNFVGTIFMVCVACFTPVFSFFGVVTSVYFFDLNTKLKYWLGFPFLNNLTTDEKSAVKKKIVAAYKTWFLEDVLACFASEINDQTSNDVKDVINKFTLSDDDEFSRIFNTFYYYKIINEFGYQPYNGSIDYKKIFLDMKDKGDFNGWQAYLKSLGEDSDDGIMEKILQKLTKIELDSISFWVVLKYQLTGEEGESLLRKSIMSPLRLIRNLTFIAFDISDKILYCAINTAIHVINSALYFAESVLYVGIYLLNPFKVLQDACKTSTLYSAFAALIVTSAAVLGGYYCSIVALMNVMIMGQICTVSFFGLLGSYELSCLYTDDLGNSCDLLNSFNQIRTDFYSYVDKIRDDDASKDADYSNMEMD